MEYAIENPCRAYGLEFIRRIHRRFGARAVCFYTSKESIPTSSQRYPELFAKDYVAASYQVGQQALPVFIEHLRRHHKISAVIPHGELEVINAITVAEGLGLDWVQPAIMRRFRDKHALKSHLRVTAPGLRINHAELASSPAEALDIVRRNRLSRFVLKPNDGCANIGVGMFSSDDPVSLIEEYWRRTHAGTVLLEEFIAGREYHCNGQVDAAGNITIIDIGRTHYAETGQREIVCLRVDPIPSTKPEFTQIADYTRRMILASGLRRCPFHAELRVDESGPCLLECAARVIGAAMVPFIEQMHGPSFDMIDLAAHYHTSRDPYGPIGLNWVNYDASLLIKIRGVAVRPETIWRIEGVEEVERLPQFVAWTDKPAIGQRLAATNSLVSSPYSLMVRCRTLDEADEVERTVRGLIQWNARPLSRLERMASRLNPAPRFNRWKLSQNREKALDVSAEFSADHQTS
jgi:hypothetical protein